MATLNIRIRLASFFIAIALRLDPESILNQQRVIDHLREAEEIIRGQLNEALFRAHDEADRIVDGYESALAKLQAEGNAEVLRLSSALEDATQRHEQIAQELQTKVGEVVDRYEDEKAELSLRFDNKLAELNDTIRNLRGMYTEASAQLADALASAEDMAQRLMRLEGEMNDKIRMLSDKYEAEKTQIRAELSAEVNRLIDQSNNLVTKYESEKLEIKSFLEKQIRDLNAQLNSYTQMYNQLHEEYKASAATAEQLSKQIADLEAKLSSVRSSAQKLISYSEKFGITLIELKNLKDIIK